MKTEQQIQKEVRHAVKEYVDVLISQRSGPGKGMAVKASDLMMASRSVGQTNNRYDSSNLVQQFANTGLNMINTTAKGDVSPKIRLQGSQLTYKPVIKKSHKQSHIPPKDKKEHHWLTWRESPTPTPPATPAQLSVCRSVTPAERRAVTPAHRSVTPAQRPVTPAQTEIMCHTITKPSSGRPMSAKPGSVVVKSIVYRPTSARNVNNAPQVNRPASRTAFTPKPPPTPAFSDISLPQHLSVTPEPIEEYTTVASKHNKYINRSQSALGTYQPAAVDYRSPTPAGSLSARIATPSDIQSVYRDVLASAQPPSIYHKTHVSGDNINPGFVPVLQSWVSNANDYERDVAYSLFQALGGKAPDAHSKAVRPRPKSAAAVGRTYQSQRRAVPAGVKTTENAWEAYQKALSNEQQLALSGQSMMHAPTSKHHQHSNMRTKSKVVKHHRMVFPPTEYTCQTSFFLNSMVPFKRDFTINPEWSSESKNASRTNFDIRQSLQTTKGMRF